MPSFRPYIQHTFGGGWATDFGPSAAVVPDQLGQVSIPFLTNAENVYYELDGGPHKFGGTTLVNATALNSGAAIRGVYDYWKMGTGGSASQRRVAVAGSVIYADNADGTFASIGTGFQTTAVWNFATFDDILIIANDATADVPRSYDMTTFQNLAGSPPNFSFSAKHQNYHFAAGVVAAPSLLYYSSALNPEQWTGGTSGSIAIDPDDGDQITAIISHKNELWVFKGPHKGSIHRITGTSSSTWARETFIEGVGCVSANAVFRLGDDLAFMWADGSIRTLSSTAAFGDMIESALTFPINSWLRDHLTFNHLKRVTAITDPGSGRAFVTIPINGSTTPNAILVIDYRFTPVRLSLLNAFDAVTLCGSLDPENQLKPLIMLGGSDGYIRKANQPTRTVGGTAITAYVTTPALDYGSPHQMKTLGGLSVGIYPRSNASFTFGWTRDAGAEQTSSVSQGGTAVLGTAAANQFTLNTSTLGGASFVHKWFETEEGGEFRSISYKLQDGNNNVDLEVHSIGAFIEPGAESMEN